MATRFEVLQRSVTGKVLFIGGLILLLLLPVGMIKDLIRERTQLYDAARANVAGAWGGPQTIGGPILVVPFEFTRTSYAQPVTITDELFLLPEEIEITGSVDTSMELFRGIYRVPVYRASFHVAGRFAPPNLGADYENLTILWDRAQIALPLADARSVKEPITLASGNGSTGFQPGGTRVPGFGPQLVAQYAELGLGALTAPQAFSFDLVLQGTETLQFLPLGDETRVRVTSQWRSPSFSGAYLPDDRAVTDTGFAAEWRVLDFGRGYASSWTSAETPQSVAASAFGVELVTPVGIHATSMRAAKYAVLIIGLTFIAYFLFELFAALRLHALQYLLIGMANCVFYLLLLALAEHIGFALAYVASATAATTLITMYSAAVLRSLRRAVPVGVLLAALYGYLYVTLRAEDYALLFGALGLFMVLAAFMYLTRRVDWFSVTFGPPRDTRDGARVQLHA